MQLSDLTAALKFYCETLGFTECFQYGDPPYYAIVNMEQAIFHLCCSEENAHRVGLGSCYIAVDEVDGFYEKVEAAGVTITTEIQSYDYGMRDFQLADPDGNVIAFGAPVSAG